MLETPLVRAISRFAPKWSVAPLVVGFYTSMLIAVALFLFAMEPFEMVYLDRR